MTPAQAAESQTVKCIQIQPTATVLKSDWFNTSQTLLPKASIITWQVLTSSSPGTAIPTDEVELEGNSTLHTLDINTFPLGTRQKEIIQGEEWQLGNCLFSPCEMCLLTQVPCSV